MVVVRVMVVVVVVKKRNARVYRKGKRHADDERMEKEGGERKRIEECGCRMTFM